MLQKKSTRPSCHPEFTTYSIRRIILFSHPYPPTSIMDQASTIPNSLSQSPRPLCCESANRTPCPNSPNSPSAPASVTQILQSICTSFSTSPLPSSPRPFHCCGKSSTCKYPHPHPHHHRSCVIWLARYRIRAWVRLVSILGRAVA